MEQNTDRMGFALIALSVVAVVLLIMNTFFGPTVKGYFNGFNDWQESTFSQINTSPSNKINPDDAKWVEKGDWGTNGYFVRDKDGNGIVYALDLQQPVIAPETAIFTKSNQKLTSLRFLDKTILPKDSNYYFAFNFNLTTFDTKNLDTSNVTDMSGMFYSMDALTALDVSNFNTSNVTDVDGMFGDMHKLTPPDTSKFDTSKMTNKDRMFARIILIS